MDKKIILIVSVIAVLGIGFALILKNPSTIPSITVSDQRLTDGSVIVSEVVAKEPSWLVIQTNENGAPGPVVGYTKINAGSNANVRVAIDAEKATPSLFAMIHEDTGKKDSFDFPDNDMPLMYKMDMVAKTFNFQQ